MDEKYLHTYSPEEQARLHEQADALESVIFQNVDFSKCSHILEIGCGTGSQTRKLLTRFPELKITSIDINDAQLAAANALFESIPEFKSRVIFQKENAENLSFEFPQFDGAFLCWILEHAHNPVRVIEEAYRVLTKDSTIVVTEVVNKSLHIPVEYPAIQKYWNAYNTYQTIAGGNPNIGLEVGNLLHHVGFKNITSHALLQHHDARNVESKSALFTYFKKLLLSAKGNLLNSGLISEIDLNAFLSEYDLFSNHPKSVFFYTALQLRATK